MSIINFDAIRSASMQEDPFRYAPYSEAFHAPGELTKAFPEAGFEWHVQRRMLEALGKKGSSSWNQHAVATRALLLLGRREPHDPHELDPVWIELAADLASVEYREALTELTGHDVRSLRMQAHFWRFEPGSHFRPHVDKPHKIVTHLLYLTEEWTPDMGGCFRVLGSEDPDDVLDEVPPLPNNALVLHRTDNAWHSVSPIPEDSGRSRKLVQVWFWGE